MCVLALSGELSLRSAGLTQKAVSKALLDVGHVLVDVSVLRVTWPPAVQVFPLAVAVAGGWPSARLVLFGADVDQAALGFGLRASGFGLRASGFGMTEMAVEAGSPHRLVVAHPFNPPYLIPLVEVVGGEKTTADVVTWTVEFFRHIGKSVISVDREVPGFIADRLQEALWREALQMVANGEAPSSRSTPRSPTGPG